MKVITVSRSYGSGGSEFARELATRSGYQYVNEAFIKGFQENPGECSPLLISLEDEVGPGFLEKVTGFMDNRNFYKSSLSLCLYEIALNSDIVLVGAGGHLVFEGYPSLISIRIVRKLSERVRAVSRDRKIDVDHAVQYIEDKDREKEKFIENYFDSDISDPLGFQIVMNLSLVDIKSALELMAPFGNTFFARPESRGSEAWLRNRLVEKKAEMVLFHLGLTRGPTVEFRADGGHLTVKGVLGGKHEKEHLFEALHKISEVTNITDELKIGVLSRMLY